MQRSDFDFELPPELIAQYPPARRGDSRLLRVARGGGVSGDYRFADLGSMLVRGDLLVFNDTRVVPARMFGRKESGGRLELLLERVIDERRILVQLSASKAARPGSRLHLDNDAVLEVEGRQGEFYVLRFVSGWGGGLLDMFIHSGHIPLPPYIRRQAESLDRERYQTLYAREYGAVAAPTAGLHFTREQLHGLMTRGIESAFITLHVGAGTFQPVREQDIDAHHMHREWFRITPAASEAIAQARSRGRRVIAVGTTTVRALEAAALDGYPEPGEYETDIFIRPGHEFRVVDAMITNFHLPGSTLLMLVCAFAGREIILKAYEHAVREGYRFYSYGDAMLITD